MDNKVKFTKEIEDKIQSLASEVYIQIEESVTQLLYETTAKESIQRAHEQPQVDNENQSAYSVEQLQQAEQVWQQQNDQLEASLSEQQQIITTLTQQLKSAANDAEQSQQSYNNQIKNAKQAFELQLSQLNEQLNQAKKSESNQEKILAAHQEKLIYLEETTKQHIRKSHGYKLELEQESKQQTTLKEEHQAVQQHYLTKEEHHKHEKISLQQKISQLENKNQTLETALLNEQATIKLSYKEMEMLKSQISIAQNEQEKAQNLITQSQTQQNKEIEQMRETAQQLRDENAKLNRQNNEQNAQSLEQIYDLESKLTEYRLKFEYAQKQLTQPGAHAQPQK